MKTVYIPIGIACEVAAVLRKKNIRKFAFPFDWGVTPIESVYECVVNNFDGLLNDIWFDETLKHTYGSYDDIGGRLKTHTDVNGRKRPTIPVICKRYNICFPHYYTDTTESTIEQVKQKMKRRVSVFQNMINSQNNLVFVYENDPRGPVPLKSDSKLKDSFDRYGYNFERLFDEDNFATYLAKIRELFNKPNMKIVHLSKLAK